MRCQAIMPDPWSELMKFGIMADRSSVIGRTNVCGTDWSFSRILRIDFDRSHLVRIAKVA